MSSGNYTRVCCENPSTGLFANLSQATEQKERFSVTGLTINGPLEPSNPFWQVQP